MKEGKILLIEDDEDHADLIINALKDKETGKEDKEVILIRDGRKAIEYFQKSDLSGKQDRTNINYDDEQCAQIVLILLDINLPKVNGIDVLKFIRKSPKHFSTPVTILSTDSNEDTIKDAYRLGANGFIKKVVSYEKLVKNLKIFKDSFAESYALS